MFRDLEPRKRRFIASAIFATGLSAFILASASVHAESLAPLPQIKPINIGQDQDQDRPKIVHIKENDQTRTRGVVVKYSFKNILKAIIPGRRDKTDYNDRVIASVYNTSLNGMAPIPQIKPQILKKFAKNIKPANTFSTVLTKTPVIKPQIIKTGALNKNDAALYKDIFASIEKGEITKAKQQLSNVKDGRVIGTALYKIYMHKDYKANFYELKNWMDHHADHASASKVYKLAQNRRPLDFKGKISKPNDKIAIRRQREPTMQSAQTYKASVKRNANQRAAIKSTLNTMANYAKNGKYADANTHIKTAHKNGTIDKTEYNIAKAKIASYALYSGDTKTALTLASQSAKGAGYHAPLSGWVSGLVHWKNGHFKSAAKAFEIPARSPYASGWMQSAGAYWTARANLRAGNIQQVSPWLERAQAHPRTFYGMMATRALGRDFDFNWNMPKYDKTAQKTLASIPAGNRAIALAEIGEISAAQNELLRISAKDKQTRRAILAFAGHAGLPSVAMRLGSADLIDKKTYHDGALYPVAAWQPKDGFKVDPALVHAVIRQELRFDPYAKSYSGARGLMQIMPVTASYVSGDSTLKTEAGVKKLARPDLNLKIGQQYIGDLLNKHYIDGDLTKLLIAYNAGPGNLLKWKKRWDTVEDPLLFIELIPVAETRQYVEKVLSNYWIYRMRAGQNTPTLNAISSGQPAIYAGLNATDNSFEIASR